MGDRDPIDVIEDAIRTGNGVPLTPQQTAHMVLDHLRCNGFHVAPIARSEKWKVLDILSKEQVDLLGEDVMVAVFGTVADMSINDWEDQHGE